MYIVKREKTPKLFKIPKKEAERTSSKHIQDQEFQFVKIGKVETRRNCFLLSSQYASMYTYF